VAVQSVSQVVTFSSGVATAYPVNVPCGAYTCATVRDRRHTLRRTIALGTGGGQYTADLVAAGKPLIGGNLNDDIYVDILDFGLFANQFNVNYGTGNTTCSTPQPHSDISGDGLVGSPDFTFVQINFLKVSEAVCSTGGVQAVAAGGAVRSITVAQLHATGRSNLAVADVNVDGVLDARDIAAWLQGARPGKPLPSGPGGGRR
jgi:hypothetical protein